MTPAILGSGMAGKALAKAFATLSVMHPEWHLQPVRWLERDVPLNAQDVFAHDTVLAIANPHGLHAPALVQAQQAGYKAILCEKPACVTLEQLRMLRTMTLPVAVMHVYRQTWGAQTLRGLVRDGELGDVLTVDGAFCSAPKERSGRVWNEDPRLTGPYGALVDLGSHWLDLAAYVIGAPPTRCTGVLRHVGSGFQDNHDDIQVRFGDSVRGRCLISKVMHGAVANLELTILGTRGAATWRHQQPDEVYVAAGTTVRRICRNDAQHGSQQPPFHGMGWLEGYIEIAYLMCRHLILGEDPVYPRLNEHIATMEALLGGTYETLAPTEVGESELIA